MSINTDTQHEKAAPRQLLHAGYLGRCIALEASRLCRPPMRLVIAAIALAATTTVSAQGPTAHFTAHEICRAGVAALFGRNVKTVKITGENGGTMFLDYVRPDDRTRSSYKCRLDGWRVMWGSVDGRWRENALDEIVEFTSTPATLTLNVGYAGEKAALHRFSKSQLSQ